MGEIINRAVENTNALKSQLSAKQAQIKTKQDEKYLLDQEITVLTEQLKTAESLINEYSVYIEEKNAEETAFFQVENPVLWNAEKPYLYTVVLNRGGEEITLKTALRKISISENYEIIP